MSKVTKATRVTVEQDGFIVETNSLEGAAPWRIAARHDRSDHVPPSFDKGMSITEVSLLRNLCDAVLGAHRDNTPTPMAPPQPEQPPTDDALSLKIGDHEIAVVPHYMFGAMTMLRSLQAIEGARVTKVAHDPGPQTSIIGPVTEQQHSATITVEWTQVGDVPVSDGGIVG